MASMRMMKTASGPDYTYQEGHTYHGVDADRAASLMEAGACVMVQEGPQTAVAPEPATRETPAWLLNMEPARYLDRYPDGKHADLAREIVEGTSG